MFALDKEESSSKIFSVGQVVTARVGNCWDKTNVLENVPVKVLAVQDRLGLTYCVETMDSAFIGMARATTQSDRESGIEVDLNCSAAVRITDPSNIQELIAASKMFGFNTATYYNERNMRKERFFEEVKYYFGADIENELQQYLESDNGELPSKLRSILVEYQKEFMDIVNKFNGFQDLGLEKLLTLDFNEAKLAA